MKKLIFTLLIIMFIPLLILAWCLGFGDIIEDMCKGTYNSFGLEGKDPISKW